MQNGTLGGAYQPLQGDYQRFATLLMTAGVYSLFATFDLKKTKINSIMEFISVRTIGIYAAHMILAYLFSAWLVNKTSRIGVYRTILGLNYYKMRKNYWKQKRLQHKEGS